MLNLNSSCNQNLFRWFTYLMPMDMSLWARFEVLLPFHHIYTPLAVETNWKHGDQKYGIEIITEDIDLTILGCNVRINIMFEHNFYIFCLIIDIEAECQDDYMKIRIGFNGSFNGLLYSSGKSC